MGRSINNINEKRAFNRNLSLFDKPIGLLVNSYDYLMHHLTRNIGNTSYYYDGYDIPIGSVSNPYYNTMYNPAWFLYDGLRNSTSNYIEYVKSVYGATLSVLNINDGVDLRNVIEFDSVGAIPTYNVLDAIRGDLPEDVSLINPNGLYTDTTIGTDGTYFVGRSLDMSISQNDKRLEANADYGITDNLKYFFGLKTDSVLDNDVLNISSHNNGISFLSDSYYSSDILSPVDTSNYGHYTDLGSYTEYFQSLGKDTKEHYKRNVYSSGKKYYPKIVEKYVDNEGKEKTNTIKGKTYLGSIGASVGHDKLNVEKERIDENGVTVVNIDELQIRYVFGTLDEHSNISDVNGSVYVYTENEGGSSTDIYGNSFNPGTRFSTYSSFGNGLTANDLLKKTNIAFKKGNYDTIMARFHTDSEKADETDTTQTAISKKYGLSRGRNLLKITPDKSQSYDNPYCRVWTFHHQYHRLADAIRPFQDRSENGSVMISQKDLYDKYGFKEFSADHTKKGFEDGRTRLGKYGVINQHNGLVNITPIDNNDPNKKVDIKNCMFSIENLAWKDSFSPADSEKSTFQNGGLSSEQKGPFGGRIMWFPPYDLKFNETVSVDWDQSNFIGRGESIYTYKNTRRSGQLSFKLLIDHPSIINYWENRGRSTSNSVDDIDDPEQQLLRFFAGCEMLSSKKAETKKVETVIEDIPQPSPNTETYTFFVFFPNNYSGFLEADDDYAVDYLTNGIGTWGTKIPYSIEGMTTFTDPNDKYYPGYSKLSILLDEAGTKVDNSYGGYEMRPGKGISYVTKKTKNNKICIAKYGEQIGESVFAQEGPSSEHDYDCKWFYRVDKNRIEDKLKQEDNYLDTESHCLNSKRGKETIINNLSVSDSSKLFSFADAFVALTESKKDSRTVLKGLIDDSPNGGYETAKKVFSNKNRIKSIKCTGQASVQGNSATKEENDNRNKQLAKQRATTIQMWLRRYLGDVKFESPLIVDAEGEKSKDSVNSIENKLHRYAKVEIMVSTEETKTVQDNEKDAFNDKREKHPMNPTYPKNTGVVNDVFVDEGANIYYDQETLERKKTYMKLRTFAKSVDYLTFNVKNDINDGNVNVNGVFNTIDTFRRINMASNDYALNYPGNNVPYVGNQGGKETDENKVVMGSGPKINNAGEQTRYDESYQTRPQDETTAIKRYDNESKFFEMLEIEEPFLHQKISDKVKYFDPAFHSVSPEGFNARLTFLHQCSRQGPTCGANDQSKDKTANNLAFGRPPVCILRIGDFYYTKIIIESIHIDYGDTMWDLNVEGIGVMPMIADVNITFNYIGGSSLSGPVSRLQNALSFNMYANTEVYDNRAELVEYDDNGNVVKFGPNPLN